MGKMRLSPEDAQDVIQSTYLKIMEKYPEKLNHPGYFMTAVRWRSLNLKKYNNKFDDDKRPDKVVSEEDDNTGMSKVYEIHFNQEFGTDYDFQKVKEYFKYLGDGQRAAIERFLAGDRIECNAHRKNLEYALRNLNAYIEKKEAVPEQLLYKLRVADYIKQIQGLFDANPKAKYGLHYISKVVTGNDKEHRQVAWPIKKLMKDGFLRKDKKSNLYMRTK